MNTDVSAAIERARAEVSMDTSLAESAWAWLTTRLLEMGSDDPARAQRFTQVKDATPAQSEEWGNYAAKAVETLLDQPKAVYPLIVTVLSESFHAGGTAVQYPTLFGQACLKNHLSRLAPLALERAFEHPELIGPHAFEHFHVLALAGCEGAPATRTNDLLKVLAVPLGPTSRAERQREALRTVFLERMEQGDHPDIDTPDGNRVMAVLRTHDPMLAAHVEAAHLVRVLPGKDRVDEMRKHRF